MVTKTLNFKGLGNEDYRHRTKSAIKQFDRNGMELELNGISWNGINSVLASFLLELMMKLMDEMMLRQG